MAGPGSERAAGGGGGLRASRADREQVVEVLKAAFVEGRLDRDEFGVRAGRALVSRTCAELAGLTADIPVRLVWARPRGPGRESVSKVAVVAAAGATGVLAGLWPVMLLAPPWPPFVLPVAVVWFVLVMAVPAGWVALLHDWHRKRAGRRAAQGLPPGAGGAASQRPAPACRPGNSRKAVTIHGTPPKPGKAACPARRCPVCGDRVEGTPRAPVRARLPSISSAAIAAP